MLACLCQDTQWQNWVIMEGAKIHAQGCEWKIVKKREEICQNTEKKIAENRISEELTGRPYLTIIIFQVFDQKKKIIHSPA